MAMLRIVVLPLLWTNRWLSPHFVKLLLQLVKLLLREDRTTVWQYRQSGRRQLSRRVALRSQNLREIPSTVPNEF
jgi:hypothetical protein